MGTILLLFASASGLLAGQMRAGRAKVVITPETGTPMAGYYSTRLGEGTHDDLHAKALVFEKDGRKAALVACDLAALSAGVIEEARVVAATETGIPAANIMISATHSHTGPVITGRGARDDAYGGALPITRSYMEELPRRIARSIKLANDDLRPARVSAGGGEEPSIAFNRRFFMNDGTVGWNPGKLNPKILRPAGPIDPRVAVVSIDTPDGAPLAAYVNYALHLDTVGGMQWSADYPFTLADTLAKIRGAELLTLFTIGAAGNVNHIDVSTKQPQKGHQEARRIGMVLAGEVLKVLTRLSAVSSAAALQVRSAIVKLDLPPVTAAELDRARTAAAKAGTKEAASFLETVFAFKAIDVTAREGRPYDAEVQVVAIGNEVAWVGLPGEVFVELGVAIKNASPFRNTIVVELANGPSTYIPDDAAYDQGNYEVVSSRVARGSGERLVQAAVGLLREMYTREP